LGEWVEFQVRQAARFKLTIEREIEVRESIVRVPYMASFII